jgi:HK97 family phage major capsid protein
MASSTTLTLPHSTPRNSTSPPARIDLAALKPVTLLDIKSPSDFVRNLRSLEAVNKRPYSLAKALSEAMAAEGTLGGLELEVDQELRVLTGRTTMPNGIMVPVEALYGRRDLDTTTSAGGGALVPTRIDETIQPFLRNQTVCGKLGATILNNLPPGNVRLPRATGTAGATWQLETASTPTTIPTFDNDVLLAPSRIEAQVLVTRQLLRQSAPDLEKFLIAEISAAIAVEVDRAALNGSGVVPEPLGILNLPVNPAGSYLYSARSPDVAFGGAASWAKVLEFPLALENARVNDDGTLGWAMAPDVRDKWQKAEQASGFPRYLWEGGAVDGKRAVSTFNMPPGKVIYGRWSDVIIGTWSSLEVLLNPYTFAGSGHVMIRVSLLVSIAYRYSSAFVTSSDSASQ